MQHPSLNGGISEVLAEHAASWPGMAYRARHNASYIRVIPGGGMARRREDPKEAALREARCLNPRPQAVADEAFTAGPEFFDARDLVQVKYEMVRRVRAGGQPVTAAAAAFGFSRPSYYQAAAAVDAGGLAALVPARPGPRRAHKLTAEVVAFASGLRDADPSLRSADLAAAIAGRFGITVHPRSVERALARAAAPKSAAGHGEQR
jgi:transposase